MGQQSLLTSKTSRCMISDSTQFDSTQFHAQFEWLVGTSVVQRGINKPFAFICHVIRQIYYKSKIKFFLVFSLPHVKT